MEIFFTLVCSYALIAARTTSAEMEMPKDDSSRLTWEGCKGNTCTSLTLNMTPNKHSSQCDIPFYPKSCIDLYRNGTKTSNIYKIYDNNNNGYHVYCDMMKSEPGMVWSLIMSWSTEHRRLFPFYKAILKTNAPVNENSPNWDLYRLGLARMESLKVQSSHWRATCSFPVNGVDYRDYVRGNFQEFDILNFLGYGTCRKVELVNIRGHIGIEVTSKWYQTSGNNFMLHMDSSSQAGTGCQFVPTAGSVTQEDNFGYYGDINDKFRCTASPSSSTQWWFGGQA